MLKTASYLATHTDFEVELVKWTGTEIDTTMLNELGVKITNVADLYEYRDHVINTEADAYVLGGAVANLCPVTPWAGKFPSHSYSVGDEFDIKFKIAPRIIDEVKKYHPRSTLIGYKLFDGSEDELIDAGWETLCGSKANVVFCNHPKTAKEKKIAVMPDGSVKHMTFNEHLEFIVRVINLKWYSTDVKPEVVDNQDILKLLTNIAIAKTHYTFGTVAIKDQNGGFFTTTRGKSGKGVCKVHSVNHETKVVTASDKATMNAPFIDKLFKANPNATCILHGHKILDEITYGYCFSGTNEETELANWLANNKKFNIDSHGFYAIFDTVEEAKEWSLNEKHN